MPALLSKNIIPKISSGTVKTIVFILLVGITIAFWLYTQMIFSHVREFQKAVIQTQVRIHLSIINPQSSYNGGGIDSELFRIGVMDAPYPSIFTDEDLNPLQGLWQNVGIAPGDTTLASRLKLKKLVAKMDRINEPERLYMPEFEARIDTLTVYEKPVGRNLPVVVTDEFGEYLYKRNITVGPSDLQSLKDIVDKIDMYAQPALFQKENEPLLIFHSVQSLKQWPIIIVKNGREPLYWQNVGVSINDTTVNGRERLAKAAESISRNGVVYNIITKHYVEVGKKVQLIHYGDLPFLSLIGWLPVIELVVILILLSIGFIGFINIKNAEQRSIWVGMAKETAHQLGTPISSLNGWFELLKSEKNINMLEKSLPDMEYDIKRLTRVAARFSNVGSKPELKPINLSDVIDEVLNYYRVRLPRMGKSVVIEGHYEGLRPVLGNNELLNWAFENMVKNSLSAIESGDGLINVNGSMSKDFKQVVLDFKDNGKGIVYSDQKKVMKPGFTTRKRGWGLGLSLVKRIIEDYHGGKVYLLESRADVGTTFRVVLPVIPEE